MKTIWKFPLELTDTQVVKMPYGARLLTVQVQNDTIAIWAEVVIAFPERMEPRTFWIVGTGHSLPASSSRYLGTVQQGRFVWHVYEATS